MPNAAFTRFTGRESALSLLLFSSEVVAMRQHSLRSRSGCRRWCVQCAAGCAAAFHRHSICRRNIQLANCFCHTSFLAPGAHVFDKQIWVTLTRNLRMQCQNVTHQATPLPLKAHPWQERTCSRRPHCATSAHTTCTALTLHRRLWLHCRQQQHPAR